MTTEITNIAPVEIESIYSIQKNPKLLIPDRLRELVTDPASLKAVHIPIWRGRLDQEYQPDLYILIAEKDGMKQYEDSTKQNEYSGWELELMNNHSLAIGENLLTPDDRILIFLSAYNYNQEIIMVDKYAETPSLQHQGLGRAFYANFENLLTRLGYKYLCGINKEDNLSFFLKIGRYTLNQLDPANPKNDYLFTLLSRKGGIPTVKFLDQGLEHQSVKPNLR